MRVLLVDGDTMVLLDPGSPKNDGVKVLRAVRAKGDLVPGLVITARDAFGTPNPRPRPAACERGSG